MQGLGCLVCVVATTASEKSLLYNEEKDRIRDDDSVLTNNLVNAK